MLLVLNHYYLVDSGVPSSGVKRSRREGGHSPLKLVKVKKGWSCTLFSLYVFMALLLCNDKGKCTINSYDHCLFTGTYRRSSHCEKEMAVQFTVCPGTPFVGQNIRLVELVSACIVWGLKGKCKTRQGKSRFNSP